MSLLREIYQRVRSLHGPVVDQALAAALPTADPLAAKFLTLTLLERNDPQGTLSLVLHFHQLPAEVQDVVAQHVLQLYGPLREAAKLSARHSSGPRNVVALVQRSRAARLAFLVADQLFHEPAELRTQAAECLLTLADWAGTRDDVREATLCDGQEAAYLQKVIEKAVEVYDHHQEARVLVALAALSPRPLHRAMESLKAPTSKAVLAMRLLLQRADDPHVRRAMLQLLPAASLTSAVHVGLRRTVKHNHLADVLSSAHLLGDARVSRALATIEEPESVLPETPLAEPLPTVAARRLPCWITTLPLAPARMVEHLARCGQEPDPLARLYALRRLIRLGLDTQAAAANDLIAGYCADSQPRLALIALRHLIRVNWPSLPPLLLRLLNSPHMEVRALAKAHLAPMGFHGLWESWPRLEPAKRLSAGRALIKIDPSFHVSLGEKLLSAERKDRLRALSMITLLNQAPLFEPALINLVQDANEMVAASAARTLGTVDSDAALSTLESALEHRDSRVRANAVEALQQLRSTRHLQRLVNIARYDDNRPRANAIGALMEMRTGESLGALVAMLNDPRAKHRTSALWLVESMGLIEVARQVAELSISDPDPEVHGRAARVIDTLINVMRTPPPRSASLSA